MSEASERPIFICYDGSDDAAKAIAVAGKLLGGGRALVCHSWVGLSRMLLHRDADKLPDPIREAAEEIDSSSADHAEELAAEGAELAIAGGFEAQPVTAKEHGDTWRALLAAAERHHAHLIVVGAHGVGRFDRLLLGSVSNALVHHSHIPVLVVRPNEGKEAGDGPLLLCYDGSDDAKRATDVAGQLFPGRRALVLNLWQSWAARTPALATGSVHGMAAQLDELADEQSGELCEEGFDRAEDVGLRAEGTSGHAHGPLWRSVLATADEVDASTIVMGSRGLSGISAVLGSVSHGVVHNSHRPVLIVPPAAKPD
jgi:nucleotide-binding universal stress UspA family protein